MRNSAYIIVGAIVVILLIVAAWMYSRSPDPSETASVNTGGSSIFNPGTGTDSGQGTTSVSSGEDFVEPGSDDFGIGGSDIAVTGAGVGVRFSQPLFTRGQIVMLIPEITPVLEGMTDRIRRVQTVIENDNRRIDDTIQDLSAIAQDLSGATSTSLSSSDIDEISSALERARNTVTEVSNRRQMINSGAQMLTVVLQEAVNQISMAQ